MKTYHERKIEKLQQRLRGRTKADGTARPGFEQNVAQIRAELEQMSLNLDTIRRIVENDGQSEEE